jgi:hypothetical protein
MRIRSTVISELILLTSLTACALPDEDDDPALDSASSSITNQDFDEADVVRIVKKAESGHNAALPMDEIAGHIVNESRRTGVPVWLILGQANNETNYGCAPCGNSTVQDGKTLTDAQGHTKIGNAHNIFGIKVAVSPWSGYYIVVNNAKFRAYSSWEESVTDYVNFILRKYQGWTLSNLVSNYAPASDPPNNPTQYTKNIVIVANSNGLSISSSTIPLPPPSAKFVAQSLSQGLVADRRYPMAIRMQNTGAATWYPAQDIRLGAQNPRDNTTWGLSRVPLLQPVPPGQTYTFNFDIFAPPAGDYNFQWQMLRENIAWFGEPSQNVVVHVAPRGISTPPDPPLPPFPSPPPAVIMWDVAGHVRDQNLKAVAGVVVQVWGNGASGAWKHYDSTTDAAGNFKVSGFIVKGGMYEVRIAGNTAGTGIGPYRAPAFTSWLSHTRDQKLRADTPLGSVAYLNQKAGSDDCAGPDTTRSGNKRCDFMYTTDGNRAHLYPPAPALQPVVCDATTDPRKPRVTIPWSAQPRATLGYYVRVDHRPNSFDLTACTGGAGSPGKTDPFDRCVDGTTHTSLTVGPIERGVPYRAWIVSGNVEGAFSQVPAQIAFTCP